MKRLIAKIVVLFLRRLMTLGFPHDMILYTELNRWLDDEAESSSRHKTTPIWYEKATHE